MNKEEKNKERDINTNSFFSSVFTDVEQQLESLYCIFIPEVQIVAGGGGHKGGGTLPSPSHVF